MSGRTEGGAVPPAIHPHAPPSPLHLPGRDAFAGGRVLAVLQLDALRQSSSRMRSASAQFLSRMKARRRSMPLRHRPLSLTSASDAEAPAVDKRPTRSSRATERRACASADRVPTASRRSSLQPLNAAGVFEIVETDALRRSVRHRHQRRTARSPSTAVRCQRCEHVLRLLQLAHAEIDRLAVVGHQHRQPQHFARPFAAAELVGLQQLVDGDEVALGSSTSSGLRPAGSRCASRYWPCARCRGRSGTGRSRSRGAGR